MLKWIVLLLLTLLTSNSFANCEAYFEEMNQKILARSIDKSLNTPALQKQFLSQLKSLPQEERKAVISKLIDVSGKDLKLVDDLTQTLESTLRENLFSNQEMVELLMKNSSTKVTYEFSESIGKVKYKLNVGDEYLKILDQEIPSLRFSAEAEKELKWTLVNQEMSEDNLSLLLKNLKTHQFDESEMEVIQSYLTHFQSENALIQKNYIEQIEGLKNKDIAGNEIKKFRQSFNKLKKYEEKSYKEALKEANERYPEKSLLEKEEYAKGKAREKSRIYENVSNGCKKKGSTPENKAAAKKFAKFKLFIGTSNTIGAYAYFNWDKDKDLQWFSKLGYEISVSMIMSWINSKILTNPNAGYVQKALMNYGTYAVSDIFSSIGYSKLFGSSDKKVEEQYEKLKNDPDFKEKLKKLHAFLEEQKVDQNFIEQFNHNFSETNFDPEKIGPEELQSQEMKEMLTEVMSDQLYEENAGSLLQTGSVAMDRYSFARLYGIYAVPKGIAVNLWIYHILCMSSLNPKTAYLKATMIYMADSIFNNAVYYKMRRTSINQ